MLRLVLLLALLAGVLASTACVTTAPAAVEAGGEASADTTKEALDAARARWDAAGLDDYRYVYEASCFCPEDVRGPFTITVRDGVVQEVLFQGHPVPVDPQRHRTVEALFDQLEAAFARPAALVRVTYDEALGYPLVAYVDYEAMAADDEMHVEIRDLTPLDG